MQDFSKIDRLEIIDEAGRAYVNCNLESLEISVQDKERTLKIFIKNKTKKETKDAELKNFSGWI